MLPEDSLLHSVLRRLNWSMKWFISPLQTIARVFAHIRLKNIETIYPFCVPPWHSDIDSIVEERDVAADYAKRHDADTCRIFVDSSCRNGKVGIGVCVDQNELLCTMVGSTSCIDNLYGELYAVKEAARLICKHLNNLNSATQIRHRTHSFTIFIDSQAVVQSLCWPYQQSGQSVIQKILRLSHSI